MGSIRCTLRGAALLSLPLVVALGAAPARAQDTGSGPPPSEEDQKTTQAREAFLRGVELVKAARWGEALSAFEASSKVRSHPVTTFNIGACQRAMSHYTLARVTLRRALAEQRPGSELPPNLISDAKGFLEEIESTTLARVEVSIRPGGAAVAVDGRPLARDPGQSGTPVLMAGVLGPGKGRVPPAQKFELLLDPGVHVITLSRKGYADAVLNKTYGSGRQTPLSIELTRLPATLRISANVPDAIVSVNGADMGPVPVDVLRPAGTHRVIVRKSGYEDSETVVTVSAGEQSDLRAKLAPESIPLTKRWWFWAGAGAVVVGGAALTYALTRPDPQPPPYDGGNTGWVAQPQGLHF